MRAPVRTLADLRPGDHVALLYETVEEYRAIVTAFVRLGIERGAKVVSIAGSQPGEALLDDLRAAGLHAEPYLASGQLSIANDHDIYLHSGAFDAQAMLAFLRDEAAQAQQQGYTGLYASGDMAWALERRPGSEHLAEYEHDVDAYLQGNSCLGLCAYDRHRFDPALLLQVLSAHRFVIVGTVLYENARLIPSEPPRDDLPMALLSHWLEDLANWREARELHPTAEQSFDAHLLDLPKQDALLFVRSIKAAQRMQQAMEHRLAVEEAVARVSNLLATGEVIDLTRILAILGEAVGAGRAYIFRFRDGVRRADNTHEWCAPGVEPQMPYLQDRDSTPLAWWMGKLQRSEEVVITDLSHLPPEAAAERQLLEPQGIRALLVVPMFSGGQLTGFLGFDDTQGPRQWPPEDIRLLRTAAETLVAHGERRRAAEALAFLAEASRVLAGSLDYETTLQSVARLCVPTLADWCVVAIVPGDGAPRHLAYAHADPAQEPLLEALRRSYLADPAGPHPANQVERTGQWAIYPEVSDAEWAAVTSDEGILSLIRRLNVRSGMIAPVVVRGRVLGSISFASTKPHRYAAPELALAEDLVRRCALAIDNARLYRKAQQAIRARDEFLSVAAHELKTPITSLRGFAQFTLRHLRCGRPPQPLQLRRAMEVIDQQSDRLSRLVTQLLDISRIEAGQLQLERRETDLVALVEGAVELARTRHAGQRIIAHTVPVRALVDPLRLEQVLANLLDNACKFNSGDRPVEVELEASSGEVAFAVRDHGIGIPREHREHIFERFYLAQAGHPGEGMGVGLYICQHIVGLHGGHIALDCPPDGGARFIVRLPARPVAR